MNSGDQTTFKFAGEEFELSKPVDCVLRVTGKGHTAVVEVKGNKYVVRVLDSNDNGQLFKSTVDPVGVACQRILDFLPTSQKELCDNLTTVYNKIKKREK